MISYPKKVSLMQGFMDMIKNEDLEKDALYIVVKSNVDDIVNILKKEGFHRLKFCENKWPSQIGNGFTKMLTRTWEMHVRILEVKDGLIAIHGEVEISRSYIQHLVSERAPILYELANLLKKHGVDYKIWHAKLNEYVSNILEDHKIRLRGKLIPIPWIPAAIAGSALGLWGLLRILALVPLWPFY